MASVTNIVNQIMENQNSFYEMKEYSLDYNAVKKNSNGSEIIIGGKR